MGKQEINFKVGETEFSLIPMRQKVAAQVFHKCLGRVLSAVAKAITGDTNEDKMASFATAIAATDFDDIWFVLEHMMRNAMVDDKEVGDLEKSGVFDDNPHLMYLVIYHGVKGNWPGYFSKLESKVGGFDSILKNTLGKMGDFPSP